LLRIRKQLNPVSVGLYLQGQVQRADSRPSSRERRRDRAKEAVECLAATVSPGYTGSCWGYPFDWETRHGPIPAGTPTVVATGMVANGLWAAHGRLGVQPAGELLLPVAAGGRLVALIDADAPFGVVAADVVEQHGAAALEAVGVLRSFAIVRAEDVAADSSSAALFLDGEANWLAALDPGTDAAPPLVIEVVGVRDLEWVAPDRWGEALAELATPELRAAVTQPARLLLADGRGADVASYTRWWLSSHTCVPTRDGGLARPGELASRAVTAS